MDTWNKADYIDEIIMKFINQCGVDINVRTYPHDSLSSEIMDWSKEVYDFCMEYLPHLEHKGSLTVNQTDMISFHIDQARGRITEQGV